MSEEPSKAEKLRLDAVDKAVLSEAAAVRKQELAMRESDNRRLVDIEKIRERTGEDRRQRVGWALAGLAIVIVILAVVAAIWTAVDRDRAKQIRQEQLQQQTAQECIKQGNIWLDGQGCLLTRAGVPAPAAS